MADIVGPRRVLHDAATPDRAEVEAIVSRYGRTPLDYFKLWPDKLYFFSSSHASVVAYRIAWSVAVSLGDPVGPAEELPSVVRSFADFRAGRGWRTAFHQVAPDLLSVYRRLGFAVVKIGEEALVDLERFATQTSQQRSFRKPTRHLEAEGHARRTMVSVSELATDHWLLETKHWLLIGLNVQLFGSGLGAEAEQWTFLATAALRAGGRPIALFLHQTLFRAKIPTTRT
jgi:lysylphosphatidylglycerol synthetase-like protein (DUF2156 family)